MNTFLLIIIALISYGLGGFNGAILASRLVHNSDVREHGSHNAGLTNYLRTYGYIGCVVVILTDVLKTVIAMLIGGWLLGLRGYPLTGRIFACFCVMLGHIWPAIYKFKGGKGVLCAGTATFLIDWRVGLICWAVFLLLVLFTRYVSLGSVCSCASFPILLLIFGHTGIDVWLGLFCALLSIFKHIPNIRRLISGKESKLRFGKKDNPFA